MTKKEIAVNAVNALKKEYPDAICSLVYTDPLQLLILSELVHLVTDFAFSDDSSISFDSPTFNVSESTVLGNVVFSVTAVSGVCGF